MVSPFERIAVTVISCSIAPGVLIDPSFVAVESASFDFVLPFSVTNAIYVPALVPASL